MDPESLFSGDNAAYLEELQSRYHADPTSVDPATRELLRSYNGAPSSGPSFAPRSIFHPRGSGAGNMAAADRQAKVGRLIYAYRNVGHREAELDPLKLTPPERALDLMLEEHGITAADLDQVVATSPMFGMPAHATFRAVVARLRQVYCGSIGLEAMGITDRVQRMWIFEQFESRVNSPAPSPAVRRRILDALTRADGFERYLGVKFMGYKRFSLEGGETLIPLMETLVESSAAAGVREVVIGMAHRGRLNVLLNVLQKPPGQMLAEFAGAGIEDPFMSGDVKYHLGYSSNRVTADGQKIHVSLCFNPSHLEAVNPVVEGRVRAKQDRYGDKTHIHALPLLIHGDAAFAGQGIVTETLNLSDLPGYRTGGTIHVIINNQIGFTTSPTEGRSTLYCTDVAKMLNIPIFHVNGDDPEAVIQVVQMAVAWRQRFHRDVVIDLYCFRRHGHNETDEPAFTHPEMYRRIGEHPGIRRKYLQSLIEQSVITEAEGESMLARFHRDLDNALQAVSQPDPEARSPLHGLWSNYHSGRADEVDTRVPQARLSELLLALNRVPEGFNVHPKLLRLFKTREEQASGKRPLDWAAAELLAYATLVTEGNRVRLSGQDVGRGTFSHRHAVLVDNVTGQSYSPLQDLDEGQQPFSAYNSSLSEAAVLGFEYGYSLDYPDALVIWEAQFGDFCNGAQIIIDNFMVSGETKWNRLSGLTLLLPHGYEGQGPEHSSARIERFLQMAAEGNIQCVNCSTPAQLYHLLRRQVRCKVRDPLVVFTPKSLLRHPQVVSSLPELAEGRFQHVIPDTNGRKRVVFCSGKVYYDLLAARGDRDVALVRVEQLYPFPLDAIRAQIAANPGASLVWCQEEPANMGPWSFVALQLLEEGIRLEYAGRKASASPATGFPARHAAEQKALVEKALGA